MRQRSRLRFGRDLMAGLTLVSVLSLCGCGLTIPSDPSGTLDAVRGGVLRAGVSPNAPFVDVTGVDEEPTGTEPTGTEVEAIEAFADHLDADVEWTIGSEEELVRDLEDGELDLVAGGLTDETPWSDKAGVTRAYDEVTDDDGRVQKLVMLAPMGENAFISELETFLSRYSREHSS
nr:transporter substrate-binding domain-containing protein [Clavibacter michiganensis]